jgi:AhpD family alkylhydroperoxidase
MDLSKIPNGNYPQTMEQRLDIQKAAPGAVKALSAVHVYLQQAGLEAPLLHLVYLRASQMNGCAYCTDMHWKDARHAGVPEQKLSLLTAWREAPFFTERERAALEWTEAVTFVTEGHVADPVYRIAREQFTEAELVNLTLAVGTINTWNRLSIAFRREAGTYQPAKA